MAGPHVDDKKIGSAYCARQERAAVHTARYERQRQCILRVTRIWIARATIYSASDQGEQGEQGEQVAPIYLTV